MKTVAIIIITSLVWVGTAFARLNTTPTDDDSLLKLPPKLELLNSSFFPADSGLYVKYNFMSTFENMDSFWMEYSHTGIFDFSLFYFDSTAYKVLFEKYVYNSKKDDPFFKDANRSMYSSDSSYMLFRVSKVGVKILSSLVRNKGEIAFYTYSKMPFLWCWQREDSSIFTRESTLIGVYNKNTSDTGFTISNYPSRGVFNRRLLGDSIFKIDDVYKIDHYNFFNSTTFDIYKLNTKNFFKKNFKRYLNPMKDLDYCTENNLRQIFTYFVSKNSELFGWIDYNNSNYCTNPPTENNYYSGVIMIKSSNKIFH